MPGESTHDNEHDDDEEDRRNKAEAGIARGAARSLGRTAGAARSLGRTAVTLPTVGRLPMPRPAVVLPRPPPARLVMPRRLPVKHVAKISDRVSQGLDLYELAAESSAKESRLLKIRSFASNLVKNTLLGLAVFETYGAMIERMAPPPAKNDVSDPYARASMLTHAVAGSAAGCAHGVAGSVWDAAFAAGREERRAVLRGTVGMIAHHAVAHSVLFASYEATKRLCVSNFTSHSNELGGEGVEPVIRVETLGCVAVAGGLAGQAQHLVSHYSEQVFTSTTLPIRWTAPPVLRPLLVAFFPSSIAFVALEYGRNG